LRKLDHELAEAMYGVYCSPRRAEPLLTEDAEFYDDIVGFETRAQWLEYLQRFAPSCQREQGADRSVVPGTFQAYPLGEGAALTTGVEQVVARNNGRVVTSRFTMLWRRGGDGRWRVSRSIRFDHREQLRR
jgi:hypothetical protein